MSGKEIPIIVPSKILQPKESILSEDNLKFISAVLEKSCVDKACISKTRLYTEIKKPLGLKIEKYQFEQAITSAIRNRKITGFEIKRGAFGGICRAGCGNIKASKKVKCTITLSNKKLIVFMAIESKILKLITETFKASPAENGDGNLFVNNRFYKLPENINSEYILEFLVSNIKW